jgi:hypothetical protein
MDDKYSFLTDEQWEKVCNLLFEDMMECRRRGIDMTPNPDGEITISFMLETDGMNWVSWRNDKGRPLSEAILAYDDSPSEVFESIDCLARTILKLMERLKESGRYKPTPIEQVRDDLFAHALRISESLGE